MPHQQTWRVYCAEDNCPFYLYSTDHKDAQQAQQDHANHHRGATVYIEEVAMEEDEPQTLEDA